MASRSGKSGDVISRVQRRSALTMRAKKKTIESTCKSCHCGLVGGIYVRYVIVSGAVKAPLNSEGVMVYLTPRPE